MNRFSIVTAIFVLFFVHPPTFGAFKIAGGDLVKVEGTEAKYTACRITNDWEIFTSPNPNGDAGGDGVTVFTTQQRKRICDPSDRTPILKTIGYFMAVSGPLLMLDTGTGPDVRQIHIYDLRKSTQVYVSSYSYPKGARIENGALIYWTNQDELAKSMGCKFGDWQPVGVDVETSVSLKTLKATKTGRSECVRRQ
ncbi:MAG: hypothetical protein HYZ73_07470 [Elusimicrobia bacterium]|nr:hypothetical protein [Elusimicrobiota bacterium]